MCTVIWDKLQTDADRKEDCDAVLHDALVTELDLSSPTDEQIKKLFDIIPMNVIYEGDSYGFADTCVREQVHLFIRENLELVKETIK